MSQAEVLAALRRAIELPADAPAAADDCAVSVGPTPDDDADSVADAADINKAFGFLVRSTARKPLTIGEARKKLLGREHTPEVADAAVARAVAGKLLDDVGFAAAWVGDRGVKRGYGRERLRRELNKRLIPEPLIDQALGLLDDVDEVAQATDLARARAQTYPATQEPHKVAGKLVSYLVRRGFPYPMAMQVARKVTAMDRNWD